MVVNTDVTVGSSFWRTSFAILTVNTYLHKHIHTHTQLTNYLPTHPLTCQNILHKVYTGCLSLFLQKCWTPNNIIKLQQAQGENEVWAYKEQLLISKMIYEGLVKEHRSVAGFDWTIRKLSTAYHMGVL